MTLNAMVTVLLPFDLNGKIGQWSGQKGKKGKFLNSKF